MWTKLRNKSRVFIISIWAALSAALFAFQFCIMPFTATATSVNIITLLQTGSSVITVLMVGIMKMIRFRAIIFALLRAIP